MKPKRGDVREDGMVFWEMNSGREWWVTPEKFTHQLEKIAEQSARRYSFNRDEAKVAMRQYRESNKYQIAEYQRRKKRRASFRKEDGSSFQAWQSSLAQPSKVFAAIANLTPDPGQTLAELIHELSGYAMEVCEQIANPTVIEDSPALTPPAAPDLF